MPVLAFSLSACDAPRMNPYDPENPDYAFVTIQGTIQTFSVPYQNIPGVNVLWSPANILVIADNNGFFKITNILPVNGKLIFQKPGYQPDTINVAWGNSKTLNFQVNLNTVPQLDSVSIYTEVFNQFAPPGQVSMLHINAKIINKDNDIDTVFVENPQLNLRKALGYDAANKIYQSDLTTQDLNISDIEQTIGLDFNITTKDLFGNEITVGSSKVTRVIKEGAIIVYPANDTTTASTPLFSWQRFNPGYSFTYMIQVYTNDFTNNPPVFSASNISSDSVSYQLSSPLPRNNYYWVIWVIDQFQNRSRSLPATFIVK